MNKIALLIPCLLVVSGCKPEEAKSPVAPPPATPAVSTAPVPSTSAPVAVPETAKNKEAAMAAEPASAVPAPVAMAPKAEVVAPPAAVEAKPLPPVSETEALALAKKKNCLACHQVDRKVLGPSWKDVATKYRGDATAAARLENVIAKGGVGAWGTLAMPAQTQVSEADRKLLVRYILNLK